MSLEPDVESMTLLRPNAMRIEPVIEIPASDEVFDATSLAEEGLEDH